MVNYATAGASDTHPAFLSHRSLRERLETIMASTTAQQQKEPAKAAPSNRLQEYLKGVRHELRAPQTHWPSRAELIRLTQIVLLLITVVALYCGGIDFLLAQLTQRLLPHH